MKNYLEFENEIKNIEEELEKIKNPYSDEGLTEVDTNRINELQNQLDTKLKEVYSDLNPWQKTLLARHEERPKAKYLIDNIFSDFINLSGDRFYGDDKSVIAGFGVFEEQSILVIGQEKGEDLDSRIKRNFGMMRPEGYRKCVRLMKLADKFNIPIISFIDTPGAYPGVGAEERGQAEAIARSIECCMTLKVPNISFIIGEGGSGGAIALASSNKVIMLENAIYSVISPEGCATILWRDPKKTLEASQAMKLSAKDLHQLGIVDEIIFEPTGGAHRDRNKIIKSIKESIRINLEKFSKLNKEEILNQRKHKFLSIGRKKGFKVSYEDSSKMTLEQGIIARFYTKFLSDQLFKTYLIAFAVIIILLGLIFF